MKSIVFLVLIPIYWSEKGLFTDLPQEQTAVLFTFHYALPGFAGFAFKKPELSGFCFFLNNNSDVLRLQYFYMIMVSLILATLSVKFILLKKTNVKKGILDNIS